MRDAHHDRLLGAGAHHLGHAIDLADRGLALGDARLEELLDARQALRDVLAGDAAGVERSHGQLRARLADRLGGDDPDRLAELHQPSGGEVTSVAHAAHAMACGAGLRGANAHAVDARLQDLEDGRLVELLVAGTIVSPVFSLTTSIAAMRPTRRSSNGSGMATDSSTVIQVPISVPQSSSRVMTSCATSTRRRVRYPESAVRSAVSARPLRAPWLEMKYSSTLIPSRRLERIGRSMIRPDGSAIRPRMPASWWTWVTFPRAPEWVIIQTGPSRSSPASIVSVTLSVVLRQTSTVCE